jgi:predicted phosphoribosyltransferase
VSLFRNRTDAGQRLAQKLLGYTNKKDLLILALPRGGVPVAFEIATVLRAPMTVFLVRKLGVPGHEEFAMGAIAEGGICLLNSNVMQQLNITEQDIQATLKKERQELDRRLQYYRQGKQLAALYDKRIILVDDGIATGATFKAAIQALKLLRPKKIILAAPVASKESL